MATTNFTAGTVIASSWLNDVNATTYVTAPNHETRITSLEGRSPVASVDTIAALKAITDHSKTPVTVLGNTAKGDGGGGVYLYDAADTTSADDGYGTIVATDAARWKLLRKITQVATTASDMATRTVERVTNHSGGTVGFVNSALRVNHTVGTGVTNFEWGITAVMDNSATAGENVAVYGQGNKLGIGPTWAGVFEARDKTNTPNPTKGLVGIEVDVFANGTDSNDSRIGVDVVAGKGMVGAGDQMGEICAGVRIGIQNNDASLARYKNGLLLEGDMIAGISIANTGATTSWGLLDSNSKPVGIQLQGTYSSAALRVPLGARVSFDLNDTIHLASGTGALSLNGAFMNLSQSFGVPSSGNVAATATAGTATLPTNPDGFIKFKIDGVIFKFPYYRN